MLIYYIVFAPQRIGHISATKCPIKMQFELKCSILNGQGTYVEKSKLNIANMWLIPLDRVTYITSYLLTLCTIWAFWQSNLCISDRKKQTNLYHCKKKRKKKKRSKGLNSFTTFSFSKLQMAVLAENHNLRNITINWRSYQVYFCECIILLFITGLRITWIQFNFWTQGV